MGGHAHLVCQVEVIEGSFRGHEEVSLSRSLDVTCSPTHLPAVHGSYLWVILLYLKDEQVAVYEVMAYRG